jgi:hypothetical protein
MVIFTCVKEGCVGWDTGEKLAEEKIRQAFRNSTGANRLEPQTPVHSKQLV